MTEELEDENSGTRKAALRQFREKFTGRISMADPRAFFQNTVALLDDPNTEVVEEALLTITDLIGKAPSLANHALIQKLRALKSEQVQAAIRAVNAALRSDFSATRLTTADSLGAPIELLKTDKTKNASGYSHFSSASPGAVLAIAGREGVRGEAGEMAQGVLSAQWLRAHEFPTDAVALEQSGSQAPFGSTLTRLERRLQRMAKISARSLGAGSGPAQPPSTSRHPNIAKNGKQSAVRNSLAAKEMFVEKMESARERIPPGLMSGIEFTPSAQEGVLRFRLVRSPSTKHEISHVTDFYVTEAGILYLQQNVVDEEGAHAGARYISISKEGKIDDSIPLVTYRENKAKKIEILSEAQIQTLIERTFRDIPDIRLRVEKEAGRDLSDRPGALGIFQNDVDVFTGNAIDFFASAEDGRIYVKAWNVESSSPVFYRFSSAQAEALSDASLFERHKAHHRVQVLDLRSLAKHIFSINLRFGNAITLKVDKESGDLLVEPSGRKTERISNVMAVVHEGSQIFLKRLIYVKKSWLAIGKRFDQINTQYLMLTPSGSQSIESSSLSPDIHNRLRYVHNINHEEEPSEGVVNPAQTLSSGIGIQPLTQDKVHKRMERIPQESVRGLKFFTSDSGGPGTNKLAFRLNEKNFQLENVHDFFASGGKLFVSFRNIEDGKKMHQSFRLKPDDDEEVEILSLDVKEYELCQRSRIQVLDFQSLSTRAVAVLRRLPPGTENRLRLEAEYRSCRPPRLHLEEWSKVSDAWISRDSIDFVKDVQFGDGKVIVTVLDSTQNRWHSVSHEVDDRVFRFTKKLKRVEAPPLPDKPSGILEEPDPKNLAPLSKTLLEQSIERIPSVIREQIVFTVNEQGRLQIRIRQAMEHINQALDIFLAKSASGYPEIHIGFLERGKIFYKKFSLALPQGADEGYIDFIAAQKRRLIVMTKEDATQRLEILERTGRISTQPVISVTPSGLELIWASGATVKRQTFIPSVTHIASGSDGQMYIRSLQGPQLAEQVVKLTENYFERIADPKTLPADVREYLGRDTASLLDEYQSLSPALQREDPLSPILLDHYLSRIPTQARPDILFGETYQTDNRLNLVIHVGQINYHVSNIILIFAARGNVYVKHRNIKGEITHKKFSARDFTHVETELKSPKEIQEFRSAYSERMEAMNAAEVTANILALPRCPNIIYWNGVRENTPVLALGVRTAGAIGGKKHHLLPFTNVLDFFVVPQNIQRQYDFYLAYLHFENGNPLGQMKWVCITGQPLGNLLSGSEQDPLNIFIQSLSEEEFERMKRQAKRGSAPRPIARGFKRIENFDEATRLMQIFEEARGTAFGRIGFLNDVEVEKTPSEDGDTISGKFDFSGFHYSGPTRLFLSQGPFVQGISLDSTQALVYTAFRGTSGQIQGGKLQYFNGQGNLQEVRVIARSLGSNQNFQLGDFLKKLMREYISIKTQQQAV
ncbi:MAG: hypothetical protein HY586_04905 [Candidatus Omnitrophica bacterium]|nr:hypothetical protein [Candidatus Omnitrophota bacterium]